MLIAALLLSLLIPTVSLAVNEMQTFAVFVKRKGKSYPTRPGEEHHPYQRRVVHYRLCNIDYNVSLIRSQ